MTRAIKKNDQRGFTMIELVFVIVILGILAAFAVPKFVNLTSNARVASLQGLQGSLQSAAALVHAQWLAQDASGSSVKMEDGTLVTVTSTAPKGYPTTSDISKAIQGLNGYVSSAGANGGTEFQLSGHQVSGCSVTYNPTTNPMTVLDSTGC